MKIEGEQITYWVGNDEAYEQCRDRAPKWLFMLAEEMRKLTKISGILDKPMATIKAALLVRSVFG